MARSTELVPLGASMQDWAEELVARAQAEGVELTGDGGLLTGQIRQVLQTGLEAEMSEHLGYEPHDPAGRGTGNSRNGYSPKRVTTEIGEVDLQVPRDRNASFEPVIVAKHQRRLEGLSASIISLYAKGLTTGEIQAHLAEIYDTSISRETISKITDEMGLLQGVGEQSDSHIPKTGGPDQRLWCVAQGHNCIGTGFDTDYATKRARELFGETETANAFRHALWIGSVALRINER